MTNPSKAKAAFPRSLPDDSGEFPGYGTGDWVALVVTVAVGIVVAGIAIRYVLDRGGILEPAPATLNGQATPQAATEHPSQVPADS